MDRYTTKQTQHGPIDNMSTGLYCEQLICNYSNDAVVAIDRNNTKTTIPPVSFHNGESCIEITLRESNKPRHARNCKTDIPISSIQITVNYNELINSPVYISECDIVLCLPNHINSVQHPRFAASYEEVVAKIHNDLKDNIKQPTLHVLANDPTGALNRIFVSIEGVIREVQVTNYIGATRVCTFLFPGKITGNFDKLCIPLEAIESGKGRVDQLHHTFYIGLTKSAIINKRTEDRNERGELFTKPQIDAQLKLERQAHATEINHLNEKYTILQNEYKFSKESAKMTFDQLNIQLSQLRGIIAGREELDKARTAELNNRKAEMGVKSEEYKLYGTIAKIALPVAISALTYLLLDKRKG